MPYRMVKMC